MSNLYSVTHSLKNLIEYQPNINEVYIGDLFENLNGNQDVHYPVSVILEQNHSVNTVEDKTTFEYSVFMVDREVENKKNVLDIHSWAISALQSVFSDLEESGLGIIDGDYQISDFEERFDSICAGAFATVRVVVDNCNLGNGFYIEKHTEVLRLRKIVENLSEEILVLEARIAELEDESLIPVLEKEIARLGYELETAQGEIVQLQTENSELHREIIKKDGEIINLEKLVEMSDETISELIKNVNELKNQLSEKQTEIEVLENEIGQKDDQINALNGQISDLNTHIGNLENQIIQKDNQISDLNRDIQFKDEEIIQKDEEISGLNTKIIELEKRIKELENKALTFENIDTDKGTAHITMVKIGTPDTNVNFEYNLNDTGWKSITPVTLENLVDAEIIEVQYGQNVQFRGDNTWSTSNDGCFKFVDVSSQPSSFKLTGNLMSMCNYSNTLGKNQFRNFFNGFSVTDASGLILSATELGNLCYVSLFTDCTNMVYGPKELPATTMKTSCYAYMFEHCRSLVKSMESLPAKILANDCYNSMFTGCISLTNAPKLYCEQLAPTSLGGMFTDCNSLRELYCANMSDLNSSISRNWLGNLNYSAVFYKNPNWSGPIIRNEDTIPSNWEIKDWDIS